MNIEQVLIEENNGKKYKSTVTGDIIYTVLPNEFGILCLRDKRGVEIENRINLFSLLNAEFEEVPKDKEEDIEIKQNKALKEEFYKMANEVLPKRYEGYERETSFTDESICNTIKSRMKYLEKEVEQNKKTTNFLTFFLIVLLITIGVLASILMLK